MEQDVATGIVAHVVLKSEGGDALLDELRQYLRTRLPDYMIPTSFVRHAALPLTSQGKIDRRALEGFVQAASATQGIALPEDSLDRALSRIWHRLLPKAQHLDSSLTFQLLGGDSLLAVKLLLQVEDLTGRKLALSTFLMDPTLPGLCRAAAAAEHDARSPVLALNRHGRRPPLFCLYELYGDISVYFGLADELGADQPVYGIRSPALHDLERLPSSMEEAARQARKWIREVQPEGTLRLLGYSWGGLLGFEIARQCREEENSQALCILLGTLAPPRVPSFAERLVHMLRWTPHWAWQFAQDRGQRGKRLLRGMTFARKLGRNLASGESVVVPDWATSPLARAHIGLSHRYHPVTRQEIPLHLFRELGSFVPQSHPAAFAWTDHEEDGGWRRWSRCRPQIHWVEGHHIDVLKHPNVVTLAREVQKLLVSR